MRGIYPIRVSFFCCHLWSLYVFDKQKTRTFSASNNWILLGDYGYGVNLDSKKRRKGRKEGRKERKKERKKEKKVTPPQCGPRNPIQM